MILFFMNTNKINAKEMANLKEIDTLTNIIPILCHVR